MNSEIDIPGRFQGNELPSRDSEARLEQWGQGYHSTAGSPMPIVARTLGPDEIEALTSYLSFIR